MNQRPYPCDLTRFPRQNKTNSKQTAKKVSNITNRIKRMKHFNLKTKSVKSLFLLLAMLLGGTSPTWADQLTVYSDADYSSDNVPFDGYNADAVQQDQMIYPSSVLTNLAGTSISQMTFYYKANETSGTNVGNWIVSLGTTEATTLSSLDTTTPLTQVFSGAITPNTEAKTITITFDTPYNYTGGNLLVEFNHPVASGYKKFTFWCAYISPAPAYSKGATRTYLPKTTFTYESSVSGPGFAVKDGSTKLTSPYAYNFGLATAGTTKTFTLSNPGTETTPIAVDVTGANGFTATIEGNATSIPAGESKTLTITMPDATANGSIVVTPTGAGLSPFTFNVSGTVRDPNKVYLDFSDGQMPEGWTSVAIGSYASSYGSPWAANTGFISQSGSSSSYEWAFTSPKLTFTNGEVVFFETEKYSSSSWYTPSIKVEYSTDGTSWTTIGSAYTDDTHDTWAKRSVTIPTADAKYIRFSGWYIKLRNIYGGEVPNEPKMVVTQPASLNFGLLYPEGSSNMTFTIANTGKAPLENITVTTGESLINEYAFHISGAPTTLAAGASQEVTITMGPKAPNTTLNTGKYVTTITINATGMEEVEFTVEGYVISNSMPKEEFTDGLPANWTNASWTFANGIATGKSSSAYLTTPKLTFSSGDVIILKARRYDSDTSDYLTVQGSSDNGSTWTAYSKKLQNADGLTYPDFGTIVLGDIPTTVNKLRFVGFYAEIDEIWGLTYAPVLSVTTGNPAAAVSTPANYDFGECAADAYVTYNFANAGAGTINITNVAITGEGAASYSTNWTTSVAVPFDLVITRTYDATKAGTAQEAVVTVTTSEGNFVINVTGTDKAANAPELAVSTTAVDFGKVTADAVETVTVTNNGTGSMTVNIYSNNSQVFTVSPAKLTDIGAGESKTFDITFKYGTPYGVKNADVIVVPTYNGEAAINITVTGKAKDPNIWSEDFSGNTLPTGWEAGANWTIADGAAKSTYNHSSSSYLTTPPLNVNATTDELTFDYVATGSNVNIIVEKSKDGGAWEICTTTPALNTYMNNGTSGTATITGLEVGTYQFRFQDDDYNLDNFEGFVLNLPDHMASITAYTIPASSSWSVTMKEGQSFEATVTVKELRGVAENLTAKLYMGDEAIGTKAGSVAANGTETLTITCTPTVAAPSGAEMHIEVEWAGATMSTETVTRYVAAITYLTLDETSSDAITAGTYDNVTLKRTFNAGWNTICLPFDIDNVETFFGAGAKAYEFSTYGNDGSLTFSTVTTLSASLPYVVYVPAAINEDIELTNITIDSNDASSPWYTRKTDSSNNAAYFRGTYAPVAAGEWTKNADTDIIYGVVGSTGKIQKAGSSATIKGFRAYFDLPAGATAPSISFEDTTTGITVLHGSEFMVNGSEVYNLNGQKVQNAQKGLYIVNGRKVVIK